MSKTKILILLLVLTAIIAVNVFDIRKKKEAKEQKEHEAFAVHFDPEFVDEVKLIRPDETVVCKKKGNEWRIVEPVEDLTARDAVDEIVRSMRVAKRQDVLDEVPDDLSQFGLAPPTVSAVVIQTAGADADGNAVDAKTTTIHLGADDSTGMFTYVKVEGQPEIFTIYAPLRNRIAKTLFAVREKNVLRTDVADIVGFKLSMGDSNYDVEKGADGNWRSTRPFSMRVDNERMTQYLGLLAKLSVQEYVEEEVEDLSEYQLDAPLVTITLFVGETRGRRILHLGKPRYKQLKAPTGEMVETTAERLGYYAKRASSPTVILVEGDVMDEVPQYLKDLRDMSLCFFEPTMAASISVKGPDGQFVCSRLSEKDWEISEPITLTADKLNTNQFLKDLASTKLVEYVSPTTAEIASLDTPDIEISVELASGEEPITVALVQTDRQDIAALVRTPTGEIGTLSKQYLANLNQDLFFFRRKGLMFFDEAACIGLAVEWKGRKPFELARDGDKWAAIIPPGIKIVQDDAINLLWAMNYIEMKSVITDEAGDNLGAYGLDKPDATVTALLTDDRKAGPLLIGSVVREDPELRYAKLAKDDTICTISAQELERIDRSLGKILGD
ncbi:DUF4340 domain-containing protein [Candidatus Hydrogenedentota bacterium]